MHVHKRHAAEYSNNAQNQKKKEINNTRIDTSMCVIVIGYILVYGIEQNVESTITTVETQTFPLVN